MGGFTEGVRAGTEMGSPLDGLFDVLKDSYARKMKEEQDYRTEQRNLKNKLTEVLGTEEIKSKYKKEEQLTEGLTKGTVQETTDMGKGTFEGTPFGEVGKRYKAINTKNATDPTGLTTEQQVQARALSRKIYGVRGAEYGLPAVYEEMKKGKSIDEIEDSLRFAGQSPEFTGPVRQAAQSILINTDANKAQTSMDYVDDLLSKGDTEGTKTQLKRLSRVQASPEESRFVVGKERTIKLLDEVQGDFNNLEKMGIDTNIFTGTAEEVAKRAGTVVNPEARKIATKIATALQSYRRSMTGVQFGMPENQEYKDMFPSIGRTKNFNTKTIEALKEVLSGDLDNFYSLSMGDENYKSLFGSGKRGEHGGQKKTITLPSGKTITIGQ